MRTWVLFAFFSWLWWGAAVIVTVVAHQWIGFLFYVPWALFQVLSILSARRGE